MSYVRHCLTFEITRITPVFEIMCARLVYSLLDRIASYIAGDVSRMGRLQIGTTDTSFGQVSLNFYLVSMDTLPT